MLNAIRQLFRRPEPVLFDVRRRAPAVNRPGVPLYEVYDTRTGAVDSGDIFDSYGVASRQASIYNELGYCPKY